MKLAWQDGKIHKHLTCSYGLQRAPKIALFYSRGTCSVETQHCHSGVRARINVIAQKQRP